MAKNAVNFTGLIPETGDSFESATQNTTGSFDGIDNKLGVIDNNITYINNNISNVDNTSDLTKMTVVTFSDLDTINKTIIGAINETIVTDSTTNGNIKIAGVESEVYAHPNHSGDVVSNGDGVTTIQSNVVNNEKLSKSPTMTIKGNNTDLTTNIKDLTVSEIQTMIQDSTHKFVTDTQITQWNSTGAVIKYYDTQALAITDEANISIGDYIETIGSSSINDGLGGEYIVKSTLTDTTGGWQIATGKYANRRVKNSKIYNAELTGNPTAPNVASGDNSTKVANTAFVKNNPTTAKAWVNFNGQGIVAIRSSYHVSSITDVGVGNYTVNFVTAMADQNYVVAPFCRDVDDAGGVSYVGQYASYAQNIYFVQLNSSYGGILYDVPVFSAVIFGN